jgi:hypothetical protein
MEYSKNNILLILFCFFSTISWSQTFNYSYIDPCTKEVKKVDVPATGGSFPITMTYYGQVQTFTPQQLTNGTFEAWTSSVYNTYGKGNPCGQVVFSTITDGVLNVSNIIVTNVLSLNSLINTVSNFSSASMGLNSVASTTSTTKSDDTKSDDNKSENKKDETKKDNPDGDDNNSGDNGNGKASGGSTKSPDTKEKSDKTDEEIKTEQNEQNKSTGSSVTKTTNNASSKERQKPAIMLTGDIVGVQRTTDKTQDSRVTSSYIRMKGDGKSSWGVSADFTVKAQIGNVTGFKSWITDKTARKHIDLVSNSVSLLPNTFTNTIVYIRIDNVKKFTGLYGVATVFGKMHEEPLIATVMIAGGMYRGKISKKVDAVAILATIYVPYMKYYTESLFDSKPILIPFLNVNYSISKTFKFGLTGGTTYSVTEDILNFQLLMGAKMTL